MLKWVEITLQDYARWYCQHVEQSKLGYPNNTPESRAVEGRGSGGGSPVVPDVMIPNEGLRICDRLIKQMPKKWHSLVFHHYIHRKPYSQKAAHFRNIDRMHNWYDGAYSIVATLEHNRGLQVHEKPDIRYNRHG